MFDNDLVYVIVNHRTTFQADVWTLTASFGTEIRRNGKTAGRTAGRMKRQYPSEPTME